MGDLIAQLTAAAKALNIDITSDAFLSAIEVASVTFEDGRGIELAFDLGRNVLVANSTSGRSVRALTAA